MAISASTSTSTLTTSASSVAASALAGVTARLATHPLDTVKTWAQAGRRERPPLRALYRGVGVAAALHAPALALYLTTYDAAKLALSPPTHGGASTATWTTYAASAVCAETVSGAVWTPLEVLKQRLQVGTGAGATGLAALIRDVREHDGVWRGLFRGYPATLAVFVPYSVLFFTAYEYLCQRWQDRHVSAEAAAAGDAGKPVPLPVAAGAGAVAAALASA